MSNENSVKASYSVQQNASNQLTAVNISEISKKDNGKVVFFWALTVLVFVGFFFIYNEAVTDISKLLNLFIITLIANFGLFAGMLFMCFSAIKFVKEYMLEKTFKYWYVATWLLSSFILYASFQLGMITT